MTSLSQPKEFFLFKIARAPIILIEVLLGALALILVAAIATSGQLWEELLKPLGAKFKVQWPLILLGVVTYFIGFLFLPIYVGHRALGWPGAVLMPIVTLALMALLDRW